MNIKIVVLASLLCAGCAAESNPFQTFYTPYYGGLATVGSKVTPPIYFYQPTGQEDVRRHDVTLVQQGYHPIGVSNFQSIWAEPHREAAAQMGRKLGADLVVYQLFPLGTRLMTVPHITYEPGESFTATTSGYVGDTFGTLTTHASTDGTFNTQYATEEVGQYQHAVVYLTKRR